MDDEAASADAGDEAHADHGDGGAGRRIARAGGVAGLARAAREGEAPNAEEACGGRTERPRADRQLGRAGVRLHRCVPLRWSCTPRCYTTMPVFKPDLFLAYDIPLD